MKVSKLRREPRLDYRYNTLYNIQNYGDNNLYPQSINDLLHASVTGMNCCNTYKQFLNGVGFIQNGNDFANETQTFDDILGCVSQDMAMFNGFYLHFNYNALYKIVTVSHVPLEMVRFVYDDNNKIKQFALHYDWGYSRNTRRPFSYDDVIYIDRFNPNPDAIDSQVKQAGGWHKYKGQILYYNPNGSDLYTLPIYSAALTDISTEAGLSNVSYRSVRNNFLTSGLLVDINDKIPETEEQTNSLQDTMNKLQGDMNACKIAVATVNSKEELPSFIDFKTLNFDREFQTTNDIVKDRIGRAFILPPILRSEDVGNNFGATIIENAYHLYNSITSNKRINIANVFNKISKYLNVIPKYPFSIKPIEFKNHSVDDVLKLYEQQIIDKNDVKTLLNL